MLIPEQVPRAGRISCLTQTGQGSFFLFFLRQQFIVHITWHGGGGGAEAAPQGITSQHHPGQLMLKGDDHSTASTSLHMDSYKVMHKTHEK
jgi:hypothetical protein